MTMVMTFRDWSEYQIKILFDGWNVTTKGQFALSWFAIVAACILYHALKYYQVRMEARKALIDKKIYMSSDALTQGILKDGLDFNTPIVESGVLYMDAEMKFNIQHAILVAFNYGLSLMLMLVAMTYNSWLFVALMVGWGIGDYTFYKRTFNLKRTLSTQQQEFDSDSAAGCH